MEIAGGTCTVCGRKVVFAQDGKCCSGCGIVVHQACDTGNACTRCGRAYEIRQPPVADPVADAIMPRGLRPSGSGTAVAVIVVAAVLLVLMFSFLMLLLMGGH